MIVDRSFKIFNIILITENLYLMSHKTFCVIQTNETLFSMIFKIHVQKIENIGTVCFSNLHVEGNLEKRSNAARKYFSYSFSSKIGPPKSICISWFRSAHGI